MSRSSLVRQSLSERPKSKPQPTIWSMTMALIGMAFGVPARSGECSQFKEPHP